MESNPDDLEKLLEDAAKNCPNTGDAYMFVGDILTRYERYEESREMLKKSLETVTDVTPKE